MKKKQADGFTRRLTIEMVSRGKKVCNKETTEKFATGKGTVGKAVDERADDAKRREETSE